MMYGCAGVPMWWCGGVALQCSKQAQLEAMASEKQAAQLQVEKQARELKEAKVGPSTACRGMLPA